MFIRAVGQTTQQSEVKLDARPIPNDLTTKIIRIDTKASSLYSTLLVASTQVGRGFVIDGESVIESADIKANAPAAIVFDILNVAGHVTFQLLMRRRGTK